MGLLSRLTAKIMPQKKADDDALLVHAMMLMAGADGSFDHEEVKAVEAYFSQLPEFKGKDFDAVYQQAVKVLKRYNSIPESVQALKDLSTPNLKAKAFLVAADIAMASDGVDEKEDQLLEAMQRVLELPDATAQKIVEVLTIKYTKG